MEKQVYDEKNGLWASCTGNIISRAWPCSPKSSVRERAMEVVNNDLIYA